MTTFNETLISISTGKRNLVTSYDSGPPLVLMHGVTRCWQCYTPILPALTPRWTISGLDFRGHGKSERVNNSYRVVDYVEDGVALLNEHFNSPVVLYGHSLGAMVVAGVAAAVPDKVRAVIMEDPPFETMGSRIRKTALLSYYTGVSALLSKGLPVAELSRALAEVTFQHPETKETFRLGDFRDATTLRFMAHCLNQIDPTVFDPIIEARWLEGYDLSQIASAIQCPSLLLQADSEVGGMLFDVDADRFTELSADCTRARLDGVGHLIHWTHVGELLRHVIAFLESLEIDR